MKEIENTICKYRQNITKERYEIKLILIVNDDLINASIPLH